MSRELGERCCSTVFDIREELLEERWPPVVVASGREKRAPEPRSVLSSHARFRSVSFSQSIVRSSRTVSCRESAASNARNPAGEKCVNLATWKSPKNDRSNAVRQAGNYKIMPGRIRARRADGPLGRRRLYFHHNKHVAHGAETLSVLSFVTSERIGSHARGKVL